MMDLSEMASRWPERVSAGASVAVSGTAPVCVLLRGLEPRCAPLGAISRRGCRGPGRAGGPAAEARSAGQRPRICRPAPAGGHGRTAARSRSAQRLGAAGLGGRPLHLLAMSLGAMVAIAWAQRHPGELARHGADQHQCAAAQSLLAAPAAARLAGAAAQPARPDVAARARSSHPGADQPHRGRLARREGAAGRLGRLAAGLASAPQQCCADCWPPRFHAPEQAPPVPLLLLAGAGDRLVDPACSRRLARTWQVPLLEHAQAGHDLPLDDPDWVAHQASLFSAGQPLRVNLFHRVRARRTGVAPLVIGKGSDRALPDG